MPNQVHNETKRARMEALIALKALLHKRFAESQIGISQEVIVERIVGEIGSGWTGNYIRAEFPIEGYQKNNIVLVKPLYYENGVIQCKIKDTV